MRFHVTVTGKKKRYHTTNSTCTMSIRDTGATLSDSLDSCESEIAIFVLCDEGTIIIKHESQFDDLFNKHPLCHTRSIFIFIFSHSLCKQ